MKKMKYQKEVKDYKIIDPSTLPSKKVCQKNFLSEMIGSIDWRNKRFISKTCNLLTILLYD